MVRPAAMTEEEHLLLNELISGRYGIHFPEHKRDLLEARLRPRLQALHLHRYLDYYLQLVCDGEAEREYLAQLVTNNETFFFRETHQFEALLDSALEELKAGAAVPGSLRLLSAGCSSGEEPYTLGIFARQSFVRLAATTVVIEAFDVDASRIEMARRAEYGRTSLRALTPEQIERYFTVVSTEPERWSLKPAFRSGVRFAHGNILDYASFGYEPPYDAVFCRNVLIYFTEPALHLAVHHFARVLRPGGLLFLGASESIIGLTDRFETVRLRDTIAYRKVGAMIRVAVADDSSFIRRAITRLLSQDDGIQLVGTATSGEELLDQLDRWRPDAIILDLSMPGIGGLQTLDRVMATRPTPVIILSTHSKKDAPQTIEALHRGAMDFIDKQEYSLVDFDALRGVLLEKLRLATGMVGDEPDEELKPRLPEPLKRPASAASTAGTFAGTEERIEIVLLGASTGGPPAIERILRDLGPSIPAPVAVVQHMPAGFTRAFAERLNAYLPLHVREAIDREPLLPGTVYIAPGGVHLTVVWDGGGLKAVLSSTPEATHRPSVDVLFASAATAVGRHAVAVLLTGMGHDGAGGMAELAKVGARTLAQDEATSVIYGMPRAAVLAGAVSESLPLPAIGGRLQELLGRG